MEQPDIIGRSYELAEQSEKRGDFVEAAGFESIGRMWYLIDKQRLGVDLDESEKVEVAEFIARHPPK